MIQTVCIALLVLLAVPQVNGAVTIERKDAGGRSMFWLETSLKRVFPRTSAGDRSTLKLISARNARISFQACARNESTRGLSVECSVTSASGLSAQVRRVGFVPMHNFTAQVPMEDQDGVGQIPGLVPDPLFPETTAMIGPAGTQPFWITVTVPRDAIPGAHTLTVHMKPADSETPADLTVEIEVSPLVVKPRKGFPVTHWWNADGIFDRYKTGRFDDRWFEITERYLADMVSHGSNVIFVPLFHHRREVVERPAQLLRVTNPSPGRYEFDWSRVKRFVAMAKRCGFEYYEWPHLWHMSITPEGKVVGASETQRVYLEKDGKLELLVPADYPATGEKYVEFLKQFLPELKEFIEEEKLLDKSYFHVSDEPAANKEDFENYQAVRNMLRELAPWTEGRVLDAMSDIRYGKMKLIDLPVPNVAAASEYIAAGIPHWVYYCCGPRGRYLNRFFDTPLPKIRMSGFLFYRLKALGFLHWGYNFWYVMDLGFNPVPQALIDPFTDGAAGTTAGGEGEPYGDSFVVYPGADGPIDSIRWEVFAESLQDYAILQSAGIKPDDPMLADIKDYAEFPRTEEWIEGTMRRILGLQE